MIIAEQIRLAIGMILACTSLPAPGPEFNQAAYLAAGLGFVRASRPTSCYFEERPSIMPTHVATFAIRWYFAPPDDPNNSDVLGTFGIESVSALQRELLKSAPDVWLRTHNISDPCEESSKVPRGVRTYSLFAVSDLDAAVMAQVLVRWLAEDGTENARQSMKEHTKTLPGMHQQLRAQIVEAKEKAQAKTSEMDPALQTYKEAVDRSPYALHPISDVPNEVRKTIFEMDKMLDVLSIEIVGIQSKISAIKKCSTQKEVLDSQTLALALKEMAIRQEIELAGAESRQQAIMRVKKREEDLYHLYTVFHDLSKESERLTGSIERDEKDLEQIEKELNRWGPEALPFSVEDNEVTTRPIQAVWP